MSVQVHAILVKSDKYICKGKLQYQMCSCKSTLDTAVKQNNTKQKVKSFKTTHHIVDWQLHMLSLYIDFHG